MIHSKTAYIAISMFWVIDIAFIGAHIIFTAMGLRVPLLNIEVDGSYPEFFQYIKWFWLLYLSLVLSVRRKQKSFIFLAVIFLILLIQDSFRIHESYGSQIAANLNMEPVLGLGLQDYGEAVVMLITGAISLSLWMLSYRFVSLEQRYIVAVTGRLLLLVGAFSVVADMLHEMMTRVGRLAYVSMGVIEDGGEMLLLSILVGLFVVYGLSGVRTAR